MYWRGYGILDSRICHADEVLTPLTETLTLPTPLVIPEVRFLSGSYISNSQKFNGTAFIKSRLDAPLASLKASPLRR